MLLRKKVNQYLKYFDEIFANMKNNVLLRIKKNKATLYKRLKTKGYETDLLSDASGKQRLSA